MYLLGTKIYCREQKYTGVNYKTIYCYTETINWFGHELMDTTLTQNATTICVVVTNKKISLPEHSLCVFSNNKNTWFIEITFVVNMENNDDWLASNKTGKKWTRIGDGELLSYAGIDFQKPIDEE